MFDLSLCAIAHTKSLFFHKLKYLWPWKFFLWCGLVPLDHCGKFSRWGYSRADVTIAQGAHIPSMCVWQSSKNFLINVERYWNDAWWHALEVFLKWFVHVCTDKRTAWQFPKNWPFVQLCKTVRVQSQSYVLFAQNVHRDQLPIKQLHNSAFTPGLLIEKWRLAHCPHMDAFAILILHVFSSCSLQFMLQYPFFFFDQLRYVVPRIHGPNCKCFKIKSDWILAHLQNCANQKHLSG